MYFKFSKDYSLDEFIKSNDFEELINDMFEYLIGYLNFKWINYITFFGEKHLNFCDKFSIKNLEEGKYELICSY